MDFFATVSDVDDTEGRRRLGEVVKAARSRKFRTVEKAKTAAEISRGAWEKVERGDHVRPYTLSAVEVALVWPAGRAQEIIDGASSAPDRDGEVAELRASLREIQRRLDELSPRSANDEVG